LRLADIQLSDVDAIAATVKPGMDIFRTFFCHMNQMPVYTKLARKFVSTDKQIEGTLQFLTAVCYMFFHCHSSLSFAVKFSFCYSLLVQHTVLSGEQNSMFLPFCVNITGWYRLKIEADV
jgi:hypothetical protein